MSRINWCSSDEHEKSFITSEPGMNDCLVLDLTTLLVSLAVSQTVHSCKFGNFHAGYIFVKLRICEVSGKYNPRERVKSFCRLLI